MIRLISSKKHADVYCAHAGAVDCLRENRPAPLADDAEVSVKYVYGAPEALRACMARIEEIRDWQVRYLASQDRMREGLGADGKFSVVLDAAIVGSPRDRAEEALRIVSTWLPGVSLLQYEAAVRAEAARGHASLLADMLPLLRSLAESIRCFSQIRPGSTLVHRDLKPSNIIVAPAMRTGGVPPRESGVSPRASGAPPRAGVVDYDSSLFAKGPTPCAGFSTMGYAPPEGVVGREGIGRCADASTDIYSFGVVAHELLYGRMPYRMSGPPDTVDLPAVYATDASLDIASGLPAEITDLIRRCLSFDREKRLDASELCARLDDELFLFAASSEACPIELKPASCADMPTRDV